jgi:hypothetical protein
VTSAARRSRGPKPDRAPRRPNLITNVATTTSTLPDSKALEGIHQSQQRRGLLPDEHYLDSGYPSAELITGSLVRYGVALITPVLLDTSRQAKAKQGFAACDFTIDWQAQQAICPAGKTSATWNPVVQEGVPKTVVTFAALDCIPCPFKQQCTTAKSNRRQLSLQPRQMTEALRHARAQQQTNLHQARYRGLAKTHLEHAYSAVALNLIRLDAWWNGHPLDRTRTTHLARLELRLAA